MIETHGGSLTCDRGDCPTLTLRSAMPGAWVACPVAGCGKSIGIDTVRPEALLYDPELNPGGRTLEDVLEQLITEVRRKQDRARQLSNVTGARESSLVVTKLEEALLWQYRRGQLTGAVDVIVKPVHPPVVVGDVANGAASSVIVPRSGTSNG